MGGKGANLGELLRAGFPVPPGFVLTTAAYDRFLAETGMHQPLSAALASPSGLDAGAAAALRQEFVPAAVPDDVAGALFAAYRALGGGAVAVRSSATAEDLPSATFAGQLETVLGVVGEEALLQAVCRCWVSLWSERVITYRRQHGLDPASIKVAVVVQRLVPAEVAGVLFTANPVTGARDEVVIEASPGLGEALVAGLVTPDHYVVRKRGLQVKERTPGRREVVIRARAGGGTERTSPSRRTLTAPTPSRTGSSGSWRTWALPSRPITGPPRMWSGPAPAGPPTWCKPGPSAPSRPRGGPAGPRAAGACPTSPARS
ncbi:MAG TPA: PEP/pyruvate-binding domain-containing protein, partial [Chloroflexota bacterium]|nr:PEP/pyruvate-binding domain-containing protein [Chloroflexota bacterium]